MDMDEIRKLFPVTRNYNFLNHAAVAPLSKPAAEAVRKYVREGLDEAGLHAGFYQHAEHVRQVAAEFINAGPDEVTFVKNTTEGLGWVANGLDWTAGDNVVTTRVEFPANMYPWMGLEARGVQLKTVGEEDGRIPLERIVGAIDGRTKVVTISAVQYASGFRTDLAELGRICKEKGVLFCVDAIQMLGMLPLDVRAMQIDFLSADGHKWLCAPEGCGIFYCNRSLLARLQPVIAGWMCMKDARDYGNYLFEYVNTACRFDIGSYNIAGIYGLGASIEMFRDIGMDKVGAQVLMLTDRLVVGLSEKGYRVVSSRAPGEASGIVTFTSDRHDLAALRGQLESEHRVVTALREGRLRVSPHFYNTTGEIDQLVSLLPGH
ncbi:MAG: aminotransferase class V-fold PLP-dependent enzyme [Phycisphaerae bacterium]|nr:aminotransferase class V-fold PLP-dependent enzyme [Phycisphaerae bacterium]